MTPFDEVEAKTQSLDREIEVREIKAQLKEIEKALDLMTVTSVGNYEVTTSSSMTQSDGLLQQMNDVGKVVLMVAVISLLTRVASWLGIASSIVCVGWIAWSRIFKKVQGTKVQGMSES